MQTARVTILMTPDRKAAFDALAASRGVSTGEFFRQAGDRAAQVPANEDETMMALALEELERMLPKWQQQLDSMEHSIDTARDSIRCAVAEAAASR